MAPKGTVSNFTETPGCLAAQAVTCFWMAVDCAAVVRLVQTLSSCAAAGAAAAGIAAHTATGARRLPRVAVDPAPSIGNRSWLIGPSFSAQHFIVSRNVD